MNKYKFKAYQKVSLWRKIEVEFEAETPEEAFNFIKENRHKDPMTLEHPNLKYGKCDVDLFTDTQLDPADNGGFHTVEWWDEKDIRIIATNAPKESKKDENVQR